MLTIGLVAEGSHDFIMLAPLIKAELEKKTSEPIEFKMLQPMPDATGVMGDGGWSRVVAWCKRYTGSQLETFFKPLFASDRPCDAIVVHMDGDALEVIAPHCAISVPAGSISVKDRVQIAADGLASILAPGQRNKVAFAIPVQHTEAWIIAIDNYRGDPSSIDAKEIFRRKHNWRKQKLEAYYQSNVQRCTSGSWKAPTCVSYAHFASEVDGLAI